MTQNEDMLTMTDACFATIAMTLKNSERTLRDVLKAISMVESQEKIKLVFIDAKSTDSSLEILQEFKEMNKEKFAAIDIASTECDITEGRNMCTEKAEGLFVLFVDSDAVIPTSIIREIKEMFLSDPRLAFINIPCVVEKGRRGWVDEFYDRIGEPLGMSCAAIRLSALKDVGSYFIGFPGGGENPNELILRLRRKGYKAIAYDKSALHIKQKPRGFSMYVKSSFLYSTIHHLQEIKAGNYVVVLKYLYYIMFLFSSFFLVFSPYPFLIFLSVGIVYYLMKSKGNPIVLPALLVGLILPIGLLFWILRGTEWENRYRKQLK